MGRTKFICRCDSTTDLAHALRDMDAHNKAPCRLLGARTDAEMRTLDPMRYATAQELVHLALSATEGSSSFSFGLSERWNRGDALVVDDACLVAYAGSLWLEVHNMQCGANSTEWFERRAAAGESPVEWYGTRGMPVNYWAGGTVVAGRGVAALCRYFAQARVRPPRECPAGPVRLAAPTAVGSIRFVVVPAGTVPVAQRTGRCAHCSAQPAIQTCSRCGVAQYCNAQCQRAHWGAHKGQCVGPD